MKRLTQAISGAVLGVLVLGGCAASAENPIAVPSPSAASLSPAPAPAPSVSPSPAPSLSPESSPAADLVAQMTLRERAASIVMGAVEGTNAGFLADYVADVPGGMILMGGNIPGSDAQMREITAAMSAVAAPPPLIAIDQEGGDVARLPWDNFASALTLKNASSEETESAFAGRAALLAASGISVNFGVVADVPRGEGSFIYRRSYGTDPETVAAHVSAAVAGESGIVATTLKHFPGHGAAEGDSHHLIPETDLTYEEWRAGDAVPFAAGIDAGAELVMTGHLRFTAVADEPASLAPEWYRILREDLGFEGVAITDDLGMLLASGEPDLADPVANGVRAVAAGADVVLMIAGSTRETASEMIDGIVVAVENGDLSEARVEEAATRVLALRASAGVGSH